MVVALAGFRTLPVGAVGFLGVFPVVFSLESYLTRCSGQRGAHGRLPVVVCRETESCEEIIEAWTRRLVAACACAAAPHRQRSVSV